MNKKTTFILILTLIYHCNIVLAQFNTVTFHRPKVAVGEVRQDTMTMPSPTAGNEIQPSYSTGKGLEVDLFSGYDLPVFVNATDSLLFGLLHDRVSVCLPLDILHTTSEYGYRSDPVMKCKRFHDGIDLRCSGAYVYSMLPGRISKVVYGKHGYGNYVEIEHGDIVCLYGHLSLATVKEGDIVPAGYVVAVSGNTGRTTGPHLHVKLTYKGKSVNPDGFISYLNRYIAALQTRIDGIRRGGQEEQNDLNVKNLLAVMDRYNVQFKKVVLAQALLETGYFTSRVCTECNNLFGLRRPSDGSYYEFPRWEDSVKAYCDYVQYKYKGGDYYQFLDRIGYAEDRDYTTKVRVIERSL